MLKTQARAVSLRLSRSRDLGRVLARLASNWRARVHSALARMHDVAPERWIVLLFVLLLLMFVVMLIVQPSRVGRGGR